MTNNIHIKLEESGSKGRYVATVDGTVATGELTFSRMSEEKVIADHTGVDDALRGKGVGQALVNRLVADAREKGFTIVPLCPFVKAQYARHPEWSDVFEE